MHVPESGPGLHWQVLAFPPHPPADEGLPSCGVYSKPANANPWSGTACSFTAGALSKTASRQIVSLITSLALWTQGSWVWPSTDQLTVPAPKTSTATTTPRDSPPS